MVWLIVNRFWYVVTVAIRVITVILYMYIQLDKGQKLDNFSVKITNCALSGFSEWNAKQEQQVQQYRPNGSSKIMKPKQKQVWYVVVKSFKTWQSFSQSDYSKTHACTGVRNLLVNISIVSFILWCLRKCEV